MRSDRPGARSADTVRQIRRITFGGAAANLCLAALKVLAGWAGRSQALVADGIHSLSDLVTDAAVLLGAHYWSAPPDPGHPYGHGRIETIVSIAIGGVLAAVGLGTGWRALATMPEARAAAPAWSVFWIALVSIAVKEALYRWTAATGRRLRSRALAANAWHHRSDALSSVPVAASVAGSHFAPHFGHLDHVAALLVSAMILHASWRIVWPCVRELMETAGDRSVNRLLQECRPAFPGIREIHKVRSRRIGGALLIDLHMLVEPGMPVSKAHALAEALQQHIEERDPDITDVLVHVEPWLQPDADTRV